MNPLATAVDAARGAVRWLWQVRLDRYVVDGWSMWPALRPGDRLLILRGAYGRRLPRHGDLVLARPVALHGRAVLKRVAGVMRTEGDGHVSRVLLLGDNEGASTDSRQFGAVALADIKGRVLLRYGPESRRGRVR